MKKTDISQNLGKNKKLKKLFSDPVLRKVFSYSLNENKKKFKNEREELIMKKILIKRISGLIAVLTVVVSLLAGCAGSNTATERQNSATEPEKSTVYSDGQSVKDISLEDAKIIAFEYAGISPDDATVYKTEIDDGIYEVEFIYGDEDYEIEVKKSTGEVVKFNKEKHKSGNVNEGGEITLEQAKTIAFEYAGVSPEDVTVLKEEFDDGKYEIEFKALNTKYEVDVNKLTGEVVKFDKEIIGNSQSASGTGIGFEGALNIAYNHAGVNPESVYDREIEFDDNHYEISFKYDGYEYEYEIFTDGTILKSEKERDYF